MTNIAICGLKNAGKTSIVDIYFKGVLKQKLMRTYDKESGIERLSFSFLDLSILVIDFIETPEYEAYFDSYSFLFSNLNGLIFVIDVQDKKNIQRSYDLYQKLKKGLQSSPVEFILIHKFDPKTSSIEMNQKKIETLFINADNLYYTSILDNSASIAVRQIMLTFFPTFIEKMDKTYALFREKGIEVSIVTKTGKLMGISGDTGDKELIAHLSQLHDEIIADQAIEMYVDTKQDQYIKRIYPLYADVFLFVKYHIALGEDESKALIGPLVAESKVASMLLAE